MKLLLAGLALAVAVGQNPPPPAPVRSLSEKRDVLQSEVAVTTLSAAELDRIGASQPVEHDTEVARAEAVIIVISIKGCSPDEQGQCRASTDIALHRPDGSVHSDVKGLSLAGGRARTAVTFATDDPVGIYRVVATVRDPVARRFARVERLFGLKE